MTMIQRIKQEISEIERHAGETQVFIGHEFRRKDLRASLRRSLEQLKLSAYFADRYITGQYILDKVCKKILVTRASVVDLSNASPNVYFELGVAIGLNKPIFVVLEQGSTVPSALESFVKVRFSSYDGLEATLAREIPKWLAVSIEHHLLYDNHCQFVDTLCQYRQHVSPKRRYLVIDHHELVDDEGRHGEQDFRRRVLSALNDLHYRPGFLDQAVVDGTFRLCDYCRWERGSDFVLCHLTRESVPSSYLLLGLAIGIGLPVLLIVKRGQTEESKYHFELPKLLQGLDALEYEHFVDLEDRLPDTVFQFLSEHQNPGGSVKSSKSLSYPERPRRQIEMPEDHAQAESEIGSTDQTSRIVSSGESITSQAGYHSCFISFSGKDEEFARKLYEDLRANGIRSWFAPEDLRPAEPLATTLSTAIGSQDKLILILSENAIKSHWVETELETALIKEGQGDSIVVPICIDDAVFQTDGPFASMIRRTRHIEDFRNWRDEDNYQRAFGRLLQDLERRDTAEDQEIQSPPLRLDAKTRTVAIGPRTIPLTDANFKLLQFLAQRRGATVKGYELWQAGWSDASLRTAVKRIRQAVEPDSRNPVYLITVRGEGVRLENVLPSAEQETSQ